MGKGSGTCTRAPLSVAASAETVIDERLGEAGATPLGEDPQSLPNRVRGLLSDEAAGWDAQPSGAEIAEECEAHPRALRAWFLEDSVLKDDVYYFESRPRMTTTVEAWTLRVPRPAAKLECFEAADPEHAASVARAREELMRSGLSLSDGTDEETERLVRERFSDADVDGILEYLRAHGQLVPERWTTKEHADLTLHGGGEVVYETEAAVTKALIDAGARIAPNPLVLNTSAGYTSQFGSGKCLELDVDGGVVRYVPHFSVGSKTVVEYENRAVFRLSEEELRAVADAARTEPQPDSRFVRVSSTMGGKERVRVWNVDELPDAHREAMLAARDSGEPREYERNGKRITETITPPSEEEIVARGWKSTDDGWVRPAEDAELAKLVERAKQEPVEIDLQWKVRQPVASISDATPADDAEPLLGYDRRLAAGKLPKSLKAHLRDRTPDERSSQSRIRRDFIPHDAPMSERGQLKTEGMSPERTLQCLQEIGLAGSLAPEVPYRALYGDGPRRGRVLPRLDDFYHGASLRTPDGYMVVHGLTGASSPTESLARLDSIIASGGLKSIAERRRMGMRVSSTCPDDDTVSRIDQGVPSSITKSPIYGGNVHFVMKPEILTRRDLWFANTSPAGGAAGYKQYTDYGQTLGQDRIWMACPVSGRQTHLDGVPSMPYNESYFQHEIPWSDIDSVMVSSAVAKQARHKIKQAQEAGLIPDTVRVETVHNSVAASVQTRSKQLGREVRLTEPSESRPRRRFRLRGRAEA